MNLWRELIKTLGARLLAVLLPGLWSDVMNTAIVAWFGRLLVNDQSLPPNRFVWLAAVLAELLAKG